MSDIVSLVNWRLKLKITNNETYDTRNGKTNNFTQLIRRFVTSVEIV